jgi:hypothetical protein
MEDISEPTGEDFAEALRQLVEYIEATNHTLVDELENVQLDEYDASGYQIKHGDHDLDLVGAPELHYFSIYYSYDLASDVAVSIARGEAPSESDQIEITEEIARQAIERLAEINSEKSDQVLGKLSSKIYQATSHPNLALKIDSGQTGGPRIIQVSKKIFVYSDDFGLQEFQDACQAVTTQGLVGKGLLTQAYNIPQMAKEMDSSESTESDDAPSRMFQ